MLSAYFLFILFIYSTVKSLKSLTLRDLFANGLLTTGFGVGLAALIRFAVGSAIS
jgi:hypothetical protein